MTMTGPTELRHELHELCQPLAALQCRLELGQMAGDDESLRQAVAGALADMKRVFACLQCLRECLSQMPIDATGKGVEA